MNSLKFKIDKSLIFPDKLHFAEVYKLFIPAAGA